jgi:hypothetical protein
MTLIGRGHHVGVLLNASTTAAGVKKKKKNSQPFSKPQ